MPATHSSLHEVSDHSDNSTNPSTTTARPRGRIFVGVGVIVSILACFSLYSSETHINNHAFATTTLTAIASGIQYSSSSFNVSLPALSDTQLHVDDPITQSPTTLPTTNVPSSNNAVPQTTTEPKNNAGLPTTTAPTVNNEVSVSPTTTAPFSTTTIVSPDATSTQSQSKVQVDHTTALRDVCRSSIIDASTVPYDSPHRFHEMLQTLENPFPAPEFSGWQKMYCDPTGNERRTREWTYCLPIKGRHDVPFCSGSDRVDLLVPHNKDTLCYSSVLHMLMMDVYNEFQYWGGKPILLYGSMLGALRNGSIIPFTEDADIGFQFTPDLDIEAIKQGLWEKGYHLFHEAIYRVCISSNHPLASNLYDPTYDTRGKATHVPYVDLYRLEERRMGTSSMWDVEKVRGGRLFPSEEIEPYSKVEVNGLEMNTVADPVNFLEWEYGSGWKKPIPRDPSSAAAKPRLNRRTSKPPPLANGAY